MRQSLSLTFCSVVLTGTTLLGGCASKVRDTADAGVVLTRDAQQALTPDAAIAELKAGNARFVANTPQDRDWLAQARQTAGGQYPKAFVLSCVDSRVPTEVVFDKDIGDIFVGRVAGNFENTDLLGSMEFATAVAGAKVIVVLGHTECGAVKGAIDGAELGNLTPMLAEISPAIPAGGGSGKDADFVDRVVESNVRRTVRDIAARSPVMLDMINKGDLKVVGAVYDLQTGQVRWLDS